MTQATIAAGSRVTANGGKLATVISIKGRWIKVRFDHNNSEKNVGFKDVTPLVEKSKRVSTKTPGHACPKCGSEEVYHGRTVNGIVQDEETVWGCHECGWDNLTKNGMVDPAARARYTRAKIGDVVCLDNDDEVAKALRGMDLFDVYKAAADVLDTTAKELKAKYEHLNNGQQRMNLGNRIRKAIRHEPTLIQYIK